MKFCTMDDVRQSLCICVIYTIISGSSCWLIGSPAPRWNYWKDQDAVDASPETVEVAVPAQQLSAAADDLSTNFLCRPFYRNLSNLRRRAADTVPSGDFLDDVAKTKRQFIPADWYFTDDDFNGDLEGNLQKRSLDGRSRKRKLCDKWMMRTGAPDRR